MNNLFWKQSNAPVPKKNKYLKMGYSRNPFPYDPCVKPGSSNELENGKVYLETLRKIEEKQFERLLIQTATDHNPRKISLLMDYASFRGRGIGKTAFLNHQLNRINGDLGYTISNHNEVLLAIYVQPGGDKGERKFWQISKLIIDSINDKKLISLGLSRIRAFSQVIPQVVLDEVNAENLEETILDDSWLDEKQVDVPLLNVRVTKMLTENGIDNDFAKQINLIGKKGNHFYNKFFVDKNDSYWRNNQSEFLFNDLVKFFRLANFSNAIILFDEAEKIITAQNFQERRAFCDNLRYFFIDGSSENVKNPFFRLLLTIHPYSQELLNPHWNASGLNRFVELGGDSANHYTIYFNPINREWAVPLAEAYIIKSKLDINDGSSIAPFTNEALHSILIKAEGIPGKFLQFLYLAVEMAAEEEWETIDVKEIEKVIKSDMTLNTATIQEDNRTLPATDAEFN